jgi:UDP-N-acetylmuramate dehydrogenase
MVHVQSIETNSLSTFRTRHQFLYYGELTTVGEFLEYRSWASHRGIELYILGNGSNTLFASRKVRTLVLRNRLEKQIKFLDNHLVEVCSSMPTLELLRQCNKQHLDSFYYLASAPATVGGAIAMNAGRGKRHNMTVFDFLESVSYVGDEGVVTVPANSIERSYRWTSFTGVNDHLIVSAVFRFPPGNYQGNPIADRLAYVKKLQDLDAPNCGSVFKEYHPGLQRRLQGLRIGGARFSSKTSNWILNSSESPWCVCTLIRISKVVHRLMGKKAVLELIEVH